MAPTRSTRKNVRYGPPIRTALDRLAETWSHAANLAGAAALTFSDDVQDSASVFNAPVPISFTYKENTYSFHPDVPKPDDGFLLSCMCEDACNGPTCSCIAASNILNSEATAQCVYSPEGLLVANVPPQVEIHECNKLCSCTFEACKNRASQRPRDFVVDVFRIAKNVWAVRAAVDIPKGKILGVHTGELIRRDADVASEHWCFDLDGPEVVGSSSVPIDASANRYTVYSGRQGNWTRFLRHSDTPNLGTISVLHDVPADSGMPFLAFVAKEDITALTILTMDYRGSDTAFAQAISSGPSSRDNEERNTRKAANKGRGKAKK